MTHHLGTDEGIVCPCDPWSCVVETPYSSLPRQRVVRGGAGLMLSARQAAHVSAGVYLEW